MRNSLVSPITKLSSLLAILLASGGVIVQVSPSLGQNSLPSCPEPQPNEYLLLVLTQTRETQEQVQRNFSDRTLTSVCRYVGGDIVTRVSGFTRFEVADSWAQYIHDNTGLLAVVVKPGQSQPAPIPRNPGSTVVVPPPNPRTPRQINSSTAPPSIPSQPGTTGNSNVNVVYNPRPLGNGYAVLVDYFSNPEIAYQLKSRLGKDIGLASYFSRPYLLVTYTDNAAEANSAARNLSNQGFSAAVVDSNRVTLLTSTIQ